ncbi:hypothetical protein SCOR_09215 [Sulfidibacter corallicola]|uniref:SMI1/KNR4 family protein n=1 Tax=Sulfidibacter corallicola TaxID=2818388 RepID=A0A8A4TND4_SULCO|nr:SMI1/KNR4 family protein [Sulfidibacter corallicola]QTD51063.1 hypothetical protein J3U87_01220 [Sulfidibacter corallicola]
MTNFNSLYLFLSEHIRGYPLNREKVEAVDDLPESVREFWKCIGYHSAFKPVLAPLPPPDHRKVPKQRTAMAKMGLNEAMLPERPLVLAHDTFSAWYLDMDDSEDDPSVWGFNSDMEKPEIISPSFAAFATQQLATIALENLPRLELEPVHAFKGEILFEGLNSKLIEHNHVVIVPFDDSKQVVDHRVILHFTTMADLVDFCEWDELELTWLCGYLDPGQGTKKLSTIRFEGLSDETLDPIATLSAEDGEVKVLVHQNEGLNGWMTREYYEPDDPSEEVLLTTDSASASAYIDWLEALGGKILERNNKPYKKKKGSK